MDFAFVIPYRELVWWAVVTAALLAVVYFGLRALERHRGVRLHRFVELHLTPRLLAGYDAKLRRPLIWLTLLGFFFLAIAIAQPHWGNNWEETQRRSHDVLVCLDVSESMRAENPLPNRLERAKHKILSIVERTPGDRFGLVVFSGAAELICPLTLDKGYFQSVLAAVDTDSISYEGTDIAAALNECIETYRTEHEGAADFSDSQSILLISDGEAVRGDAVAAAQSAANFARIFVIGVGDPRGTEVRFTPKVGQPGVLTPTSEPHMSRLDEATLSRIATEGGGGYIRSRPDNSDVDEIYGLIDRMSARQTEGDIRHRLVNRYQWPLAFAIACFAGEGMWLVLLPLFRSRRGSQGLTAQESGHA